MPSEKRTFYATAENVVVAIRDAGAATEELKFSNGRFETSNPLYIAKLERLAENPDAPVSDKPPAKKE